MGVEQADRRRRAGEAVGARLVAVGDAAGKARGQAARQGDDAAPVRGELAHVERRLAAIEPLQEAQRAELDEVAVALVALREFSGVLGTTDADVIDTFDAPLDLATYRDEYREGLQRLIDAGDLLTQAATAHLPQTLDLIDDLNDEIVSSRLVIQLVVCLCCANAASPSIASPKSYYYVTLFFFLLCLLSARSLRRSRAGRVIIAAREANGTAIRSAGAHFPAIKTLEDAIHKIDLETRDLLASTGAGTLIIRAITNGIERFAHKIDLAGMFAGSGRMNCATTRRTTMMMRIRRAHFIRPAPL